MRNESRTALTGFVAFVGIATILAACNHSSSSNNSSSTTGAALASPIANPSQPVSPVTSTSTAQTTPNPSAVSPSPLPSTSPSPGGSGSKWLWVANSTGDSISGIALDAAGALTTTGTPVTTTTGAGSAPGIILLDGSGNHLVTAFGGTNKVQSFTINHTTGVLTAVNATPIATVGTVPIGVTINSANTFLYSADSNAGGAEQISCFNYVAATGVITPQTVTGVTGPASGMDTWDVCMSPSGGLLFAANHGSDEMTAYKVGATGALTLVGTTNTAVDAGPHFVLAHPTLPAIYTANLGGGVSGTVSQLNYTTAGVLSAPTTRDIPTSSGSSNTRELAMNAAGTFLYSSNQISDDVAVFSINATTGALSANGSNGALAVGATPEGIILNSSGTVLYVANTGNDTISAFAVGTNGQLMAAPVTTAAGFITAGSGPYGLAVSQ